MISEKEAKEIWDTEKLPIEVREHCKTVCRAAVRIAKRLIKKGRRVDVGLVKTGALLHDIGRSRENGIRHAVAGVNILKKHKLPKNVIRIVERHLGSGIDAKEARALGLPARDYRPKSVEQKIVSYADNLVSGKRVRSFAETRKDFAKKFGEGSSQVRRLDAQHRTLG